VVALVARRIGGSLAAHKTGTLRSGVTPSTGEWTLASQILHKIIAGRFTS